MPQPPQVFESSSDPAESHQRDLAKRGAAVESVPPRKHRKFTVAEKLRIVKAAEAAVASGVRGKLEALLRKEGIYSSLLAIWRRQFAAKGKAGLTASKPGRVPKLDDNARALLALTKKNAELERRLQIANAVIELQKKAHELLGLTLPQIDEAL